MAYFHLFLFSHHFRHAKKQKRTIAFGFVAHILCISITREIGKCFLHFLLRRHREPFLCVGGKTHIVTGKLPPTVSSCFLSSDKRCDGSLECCMFSGSHQARALLSTHCLLARGVVEGIQFQALASDKIRTNILSEGYKNSVWLSSLGEIFCCECSTQSPPRSQV